MDLIGQRKGFSHFRTDWFYSVDPQVETSSKAVLVTGCDTGFGFALAQHLHELGFFVFAGCLMKDKGGDGVKKLDAEGKSTGRLVTVQLDVTNDAQVKAAVQTVKDTLPSNIKVSPCIIFP